MYLIPVSCPLSGIAVKLVIADKACAERFARTLDGAPDYKVSPIEECTQSEAHDIQRARDEYQDWFVAGVMRHLQKESRHVPTSR
jgi:hypothetical protein